jgi:DNA-binding winged helix-turn-helix (wHTH) protein
MSSGPERHGTLAPPPALPAPARGRQAWRCGAIFVGQGIGMTPGRQSRDVVRFSSYEVHLRAGELFRAGHKIRLQEQPFRVLAMLLEHPGEVVARADLQKRLWPADTFVDFDHSLNTAVKKLREALSDDKKNPRFVETLPKRGYRFVGALVNDENVPNDANDQNAKPSSSAPPPSRAHSLPSTNCAAASSWIGRVARVATEGKPTFVLVSADEKSAVEREKLDAANDDVGLSLLIAGQKVFLVHKGTPVRILEVHETASRCLVRILEGEHYGKTALMPLQFLAELE